MGADLIATNPDLLARNPELGRMLGMSGFRPEPESSAIEVAALDVLKPAVENHVALKWHDRLETICGKRGLVKVQDDSDGTAQVTFQDEGITAWLPQSALKEISDDKDTTAVDDESNENSD